MTSQKAGIKLNTEMWHYKLIQFILGDNAPTPETIHNLCPYFWLLVFSLLVCPFYGFIKVIIKFFEWSFNKIIDFTDKLLVEPTARSWYESLNDYDIYYIRTGRKKIPNFYKNSKQGKNKNGYSLNTSEFLEKWFREKRHFQYMDKGHYGRCTEEFYKWHDVIYGKISEQEKILAEREHVKVVKRQEFNKNINEGVNKIKKEVNSWKNIIKWTKRVVGLIITTGLLYLTYLLVNIIGRFILWSIYNFNVDLFTDVIKWTGIVIGGIVVVIGFIYFMTLWVKYIAQNGLKLWYAKLVYYPLYWLIYIPIKLLFYNLLFEIILVNLIIGIVEGSKIVYNAFMGFLGIFGEYFGASYTDYCPGIEWEENKTKK